MTRPYNFAPGPATLPLEVLQEAAAEMTDWHGSGMSVMEMSHRGEEFMSIHTAALADARELLSVPDNYKLIFLQGGGLGENAIVPMNLAGGKHQPATPQPAAPRPATPRPAAVDFILTGSWTRKSAKEAEKYCRVNIAATAEASKFTTIPPRAEWKLTPDAAYVHICSNETIDGIEYHFVPDVGDVPLVADMSSHIMARPVDVARYGAIFGGAQKNLGPAGLTMVIVREDLLDQAMPICPSAFNWKTIADNNSMYNTPPTYAIYIAGLVFKWLKKQGGVAEMEKRNIAKSALLYDYLDATGFYQNRVAREHRSRMNVPFYLKDETLNAAFLAGAKEHGLLQLKGHKSVGGMRASLYNAMPIEGVQALVAYMKDFERHV